jgi:uncharacterized protein (UPF0248 family)
MVYGVLGRLLWRGELDKAEIVIIHRGAPGDSKIIPGGLVTHVKRSHLIYRGNNITGALSAKTTGKEAERQVTIPLHRVLEVRLDGKKIWKRARKP